jgi:LPS sulfotransferase NodH
MSVLRALRKHFITLRKVTGSASPRPTLDVRQCKDAVAMFHTGRSGSTVLARMLNQHSDICWPGELFENMVERYSGAPRDRNVVEYVLGDWSARCRARKKSILGFETKYLPHQHFRKEFLNTTLEDYLQLLRHLRAWKFIVLRRDNYLRRAISAQVGVHTKTWHSKQRQGGPTRITLDVHTFKTGNHRESLFELFHRLDENYEKLSELLKADQVLHLSYEEDILDDPMVAYGKVCDFLGVQRESPDVDLARTNPFPCEAMLHNFDEVSSLLRGTKYEWMLFSR